MIGGPWYPGRGWDPDDQQRQGRTQADRAGIGPLDNSNAIARLQPAELAWMAHRNQLGSRLLLVTNTSDNSNSNSLRWAILQANSAGSSSTIAFNIPGPMPASIRLSSPLPLLVNPVSIDGTTEPGYRVYRSSKSTVRVCRAPGTNGLVISGGGSTIQGLSIVGFSGSAIVLESASGNIVEGDYLGVDADGTEAIPNGQGLPILGSSPIRSASGRAGPAMSSPATRAMAS